MLNSSMAVNIWNLNRRAEYRNRFAGPRGIRKRFPNFTAQRSNRQVYEFICLNYNETQRN